ncbi:MAG: T9SS type A sorting domain-containing protein [Chlorobi bacterium]|nr:T9SS type A sorting domain-containing protein [Chlorobiota bacterium]
MKQIDTDGAFEYSPEIEVVIGAPKKFNLEQNFPNPFNPSTIISYSIPEGSFVQLSVFNILGQKVAQIVNERKEAGTYKINFDASALQSGIYFYQITTDKFSEVKKMMLVK